MDTSRKILSKALYEVLDVIGASDDTRKKYWELAILYEIQITFLNQLYFNSKDITVYQVGSSYEGTTTLGLDSDVDMIHCDERIPVVDNLEDSNLQGMSYLCLTDEYTKPGYVHLQIVSNQCPRTDDNYEIADSSMFGIDRKGRICTKHSIFPVAPNTYRNGPADTVPPIFGSCTMDIVHALRCRHIHMSGISWLLKNRKYNWPSQKQLKSMGSADCFLVGVGHPHSDNKSIEWRISFSLQERALMSSLNETQYKCYILLKMIKKNIIESKIGESISSYHCKTSLFYTIESSHRQWWTESNLILCVQLCLIRLFSWVKAKNCPNYFIPKENMFDKISFVTLNEIENVLSIILHSGVNFLYSITCDNVGELLKSKTCDFKQIYSQRNTSTMLELDPSIPRGVYTLNAIHVFGERNSCMNWSSNTNTNYLNGMKQLLHSLQNTSKVTEHKTSEVTLALATMIQPIKLQLQQCMFAQYLSHGKLSRLRDKAISNVLLETRDCDLISSKLSLASLYIQYEQRQVECKCILVSCENSLEPYVISLCECYTNEIHANPAVKEKVRFIDMTRIDFRRHCITGCMIFHTSQVSLVHKTLQYEMFRTVYTKPRSEIEMIHDYWLNWITVDSQIYLYFLQYLLYSKSKKKVEKETAVQKLIHVKNTDYNLGHKETAMNLCGWIRLQENEVLEAWKLFCLSWKIRPFTNAAKWHMLIVLSEVIKRQYGLHES